MQVEIGEIKIGDMFQVIWLICEMCNVWWLFSFTLCVIL